MSKVYPEIRSFAGISNSEKNGLVSQYLFARSIDYRTDPSKFTILPRTMKESGSVVTNLVTWAARKGDDTYLYDKAGAIYKRTNAAVWSKINIVPSSQGNGMGYFGEDGFLYYTSDTVIGRYGPLNITGASPTFVDDFLGSEGGVPLNTHSLTLNGTSQYATAADSASLSITGDLSIEIFAKLTSLPDIGESITLVSKWNENGNQRSYSFDLKAISGFFGDEGDGSLTISSNTTDAPVDSSASGTAAAYTLTATNASFAAGQKILIHQTRGTGAGAWEENEIAGYTTGTITLSNALSNTYTTSGVSAAQVIVIKEYSSITVNSGFTLSAKAWNGTVGGIIAYKCSGTTTVNGSISGTGRGFRGGGTSGDKAYAGEGISVSFNSDFSKNAAGNSGGGSGDPADQVGGGGGGNGTAGDNDDADAGAGRSIGGDAAGTADLTTMVFGGGGGAWVENSGSKGDGGAGGAIIFLSSVTITVNGSIVSNGNTAPSPGWGGGGGGAGGSILLKAQTAALGTSLVTASGGSGGNGTSVDGGNGGAGRIHIDYLTSFTGTTSPTINSAQDDTLVTTASYQLALALSSTGTNEETLTKTIIEGLETGVWRRYGVTFDASASQANFYLGGTSIGQSTGTLTSIYDSTALLAIGAHFDSGGSAEQFLAGKVDDVRIWDDIRTASELSVNSLVEILGTSTNLVAYYELDNSESDQTANGNDLTLVGSPTYDSSDVPFASPTNRNDLDQSLDTSGQTYTVPTSISETSANKQEFIPRKDPQKSIEVNIAGKGTGDWTLTVHDGLNRVVASKTVTNANLSTGDFEFEFDEVWTPIIGQTYHFHLTSTVADGTVVTTTTSDLNTADFHTYYQFLIEDEYHPIEDVLNKKAIGNGRYLATWDGISYDPHRLTFPSGFRVRALGTWREYLAIGCTRGSDITDYDKGIIFFWDGTSDTYNFYREVNEGGINAILSGDPMYFVAGYSGQLMKFEGGKPRKIRKLPKVTNTTYMDVAPGAINMWKSLVRIGTANNTDSSIIEQGVYSYGTLYDDVPDSLSFDYPISTGSTTGTDIRIGLVFPLGRNLLISWKSGASYGVDIVKPDNSPYASASYEGLITDAGKLRNEKEAFNFRAYFSPLISGDSVNLKYKIDRESEWKTGTAQTTAGEKEVRLQVPAKNRVFNEFQFGIDITTSTSVTPEIYGITGEFDVLENERIV